VKKLANYTKWMLVLSGILMIVLSCIIFTNPFTSAWSAANLAGWIMLIAGIVDVVAFIVNFDRFYAGWLLVRGLVTALIGSVFAFRPEMTMDLIMVILGIWVIISGGVQFANAFVVKAVGIRDWFWPALGGIVEIIAGVIILMNPGFSLAVSAYLIAAGLLVDGITNLVDAFRIQQGLSEAKRWEKAVKKLFGAS